MSDVLLNPVFNQDELEKLEKATTDNWDKFAPRMAKVMKDLKQAYTKSHSYLEEKKEVSYQ